LDLRVQYLRREDFYKLPYSLDLRVQYLRRGNFYKLPYSLGLRVQYLKREDFSFDLFVDHPFIQECEFECE
jgi:hypothetical protein